MSISFNNTTDKNGIIQLQERNCGFNDGDISGNSTRLAYFTADTNLALDRVTEIAIRSGGIWRWDDSNHTKYPIITTNLVANQRDYSFTSDGDGNLILGIYKVYVKDESGVYHEVYPVDIQADRTKETAAFTDGEEEAGRPYRYRLVANGIFLDWVPSYDSTGGLKIEIDREASYFTTADTTKKAGIPGIFHEYLALRPSYFYCLRNKMFDLASAYKTEMLDMEKKMEDHFSKKGAKVKRPRMEMLKENNK